MNLTSLQSKTRFLLGGLETDNYSDTNLTRALNDYYHQAISIALKSSGQWEVNGEIATTDLVANQQEYILPVTLLSLKKIEANFLNDTLTWEDLNIRDLRNRNNVSNDDAQSATTAIKEIDVYDNSLFLQYKPLNSVTAGLKIYYSKEAVELSAGSDEPNIPEPLHLYLVYGACADYALRTENDQDYNKFMGLLLKKEAEIKISYANRLTAVRPRVVPRSDKYN